MTAGYLRLSRDEDRKQYVSIENQKLIVRQYASAAGMGIDVFYEDDNISGYTFERPGMKKMLEDIDSGLVDTVLAKDLSRLGRHNAKVLLLIEDFKERGIRLILVDDNYDSFHSEEDDILGIKTWYNERYVKDTSRKLKRMLRARQKEGTLAVRPCFGYSVMPDNKLGLSVVESEAKIIRKIFHLYLDGSGYRKIAEILNDEGVLTPSVLMKQRSSKGFSGTAAERWSSEMVREILKNDNYVGTLRMHVRERKTIHGTDLRVPKEEQYVFENHHEAIIDAGTFRTAQEIMVKRIRNNYKGQRVNYSIFSQCIFCRDCGNRMNLVRRKKRRQQTYFICRTYNAKGKRYCSAHTLDENELLEAVLHYLQVCREMLYGDILEYRLEQRETREKQEAGLRKELDASLSKQQRKLEVVLEQKVTKMAADMENAHIWEATYGKLEKDILWQIRRLQEQIRELELEQEKQKESEGSAANAIDILDKVIADKELTAKDVELLIDRIIVDRDGSFEIKLRHGLAALVDEKEVARKLESEKNIFRDVLKVVLEEEQTRGYTSVKHMSRRLKELGWMVSPRSSGPFLLQLVDMGIVKKTDNPLKPYAIVAGGEEIRGYIDLEK